MRVSPLCFDNHSELPPDERKCKGRVVLKGSFVSEHNSNLAAFEEIIRILDDRINDDRHHRMSAGMDHTTFGCAKAYTQSELRVRNPGYGCQVASGRKDGRRSTGTRSSDYDWRCTTTLYRLRSWTRHCTEKLRSVGSQPVTN